MDLNALEKVTKKLSSSSNLPLDLMVDFILHYCPDGCGSGHVRGQCIHLHECATSFARRGGWL